MPEKHRKVLRFLNLRFVFPHGSHASKEVILNAETLLLSIGRPLHDVIGVVDRFSHPRICVTWSIADSAQHATSNDACGSYLKVLLTAALAA